MTRTLPLALLLLLAASPASAAQVVSKCFMEVDGRVYIDGPCRFEADPDGGFGIETLTPKRPGKSWPWQVSVDSGGGYWNNDEGFPALHQHDNFGGPMRRDGACYVNDRAKVCAWK